MRMLYRLLAGSCAAAGVVLGAVAVPDKTCRTLSENVLFKGGSAVDAAIVASLCSGVINAYASGIGGGAFMLVQPSFESANFSSNMVDEDGRQIDPLDPVMIDCRETAPSNLDKELISRTGFKRKSLEIGIPGELWCFKVAHDTWGRLPWSHLFQDVIDLALNGFPLPSNVAQRLINEQSFIFNDTSPSSAAIREVYAPNGVLLKEGEMCYRTRLGSTLTAIARHGISAFYSRSSSIATSIVSTVQGKDLGGILSASDLEAFRPVLRRPVFGNYKKFRITTTTLPSSGPLMVSMLGIIEAHPLFQNSSTMADGIINGAKFHAIVEAIKFATAQRAILGDRTVELDLDMERMTYILNHIVHPNTARKNSGKISDKSTFPPANYAPDEVSEHLFANVEEEGTCHISALKGQEAVSITTTINSSFGSKIVDAETGIILNNQLADFSFPGQTDSLGYPSNPVNFPKAGRKPMSSMCPTILQDAEGTIIIIGGSGGKRIYSSVFQALIGILEFGMTAEEAVSFPRLYHPLAPNKIDIEPVFRDVYPEVVAGLRQRKHVLNWLGEGQTSPVVASLTQVIVKRSDNSSLVEVGVDPRLYKIGYGQ